MFNIIDAKAAVYFVHPDHLGTPQAVTDQTGTVKWRADFDPFGKATISTSTLPSTVSMNLRLPGQYFDTETGLHDNHFRTFDPVAGRYLQSDPIGLDGGINTYAYVASNPLLNIDPLGLRRWPGGISSDARDETISRFPLPGDGHWNGPADAFRHCLASCMVSRENSSLESWLLGAANEKYGNLGHNQNPQEETMDSWNNSCGDYLSDQSGNCADNCLKALEDGVLDPGNGGGPFPGPGYWY